MKQNWKRTLQGALLGVALLAMAGCGSNNVMDTYSFWPSSYPCWSI